MRFLLKYVVAGFAVLFLTSNIIAQDKPDTVPVTGGEDIVTDMQITDALDSLLNLWYIKHALINDTTTYKDTEISAVDTVTQEYPDSVYKERLSRLPGLVRLSYNDIVKKFIEVYTIKRRDQVEVMLGLSEYYFPVFEQVLDANNLPLELKYLPIIESALNPRAVSRAGATGIWQFMYTTSKLYKLKVNTFVDERRDPVKSTYAAVEYLKDLHNIYHDWILVIAAYNCGPGNLNRAIRRSGGNTNYWEIYYRLPRETRGYVPAFIAASYIMNYYQEHDLEPRKMGLPLAIDTIMINEELHLKQVAEVLGIPLQRLRDINPQFKKDIIPAHKDNYALKLPVEYTPVFINLQDSIFAYKDSLFFNIKKSDVTPSSRTASRYVPPPPSKDMIAVYYTVQAGDNLGYISEWYNVRIADLRYWNDIHRNLIRAGQKIIIYIHKDKADHYKKINSMSFAQKQKMTGKSTSVTVSTGNNRNVTESDSNYIYYTVKSGDNLWDIAKKFPGVSNTDIMKLNNITNARRLTPGQKLKIKKKS